MIALKKIAVFATHPIQYQAPWFRDLANDARFHVKVFYAEIPSPTEQGRGFNQPIKWDDELRGGYEDEVMQRYPFPFPAPNFFLPVVRGLKRHIDEFKPDVALVFGWNKLSLIQAVWSCRRARIPIIYRAESNDKRDRPAWLVALQRLIVRQASAALAIGNSNQNFLEKRGLSKRDIYLAPYFVDNHAFRSKALKLAPLREELRSHWGIPSGAFCLLFVGKFEPKKRLKDFLLALEEAQSKSPLVYGLIVGNGIEWEEATALVKERNIAVTFAGFLNQSRISEAYVAADALVLPSDYGETWGLVCNEAMASGIPAIVSDRVGCADDLVIDTVTGGVVPFNQPEALGRIMVQWATKKQDYETVKRRAGEHLSSGYCIRRASDMLYEAVEGIISKKSSK